MTPGELLGCIALVVWLVGTGVIAHLIPKVLEENDFTQMLMALEPERVSLLLALIAVSWPVSIPALIVMTAAKGK